MQFLATQGDARDGVLAQRPGERLTEEPPVVSVQAPPLSVAIILLCVHWYGKDGISYRDLAEMMQERAVEVDPSTIFRWVQRYAPEIEKRVRQHQGPRSGSWRVDETYVRVSGRR
jgi:hypothetical protein